MITETYEGETPTLVCDTAPVMLDDLGAERIVLSLAPHGSTQRIDLDGERLQVSGPLVSVQLTQQETLALRGRVTAQLNALLEDGRRVASAPIVFTVSSNIYDEVMQ